jgi:hypothetical protein
MSKIIGSKLVKEMRHQVPSTVLFYTHSPLGCRVTYGITYLLTQVSTANSGGSYLQQKEKTVLTQVWAAQYCTATVQWRDYVQHTHTHNTYTHTQHTQHIHTHNTHTTNTHTHTHTTHNTHTQHNTHTHNTHTTHTRTQHTHTTHTQHIHAHNTHTHTHTHTHTTKLSALYSPSSWVSLNKRTLRLIQRFSQRCLLTCSPTRVCLG